MSETEQTTDPKVRRMTEDDLKEFVLGCVDGRIFLAEHIARSQQEQLLGMVFMPIAMGAFSGWTPEELREVGTVYEYVNQAGPRSINGYPIFFSFRTIHSEDWKRAREAIIAEQERRKNIKV